MGTKLIYEETFMTDKVPESELADALAFAANIVNNTTVFTELIRKEEEETAKLSFAEIDQFYSLKAYAELLISEINNLMAARIACESCNT